MAKKYPKGPLHGLQVLEMGSAVTGPLCCSLLGDMGAEVVKVEMPGRGDDSRLWGEQVKGESPYFIQYNRNKRGVTLNIKSKGGKEVLTKLIRKSDVLVENFRPGTLARLGFPYSLLRQLNPGLIYCAISGFGSSGPYKEFGGYDALIQGMSGVMDVTGEEDGPPLRVGFPVTDIVAALYAAFSVVAAIHSRGTSKKGQMIDASLFEAGVSSVAQWMTINSLTGKKVKRFGNKYPLLAPYEVFDAADRPFVLAVGNDQMWSKLCGLIGRNELVSDPRFRTNPDRIKPENRKAIRQLLDNVFKTRSASVWVGLLRKEGIPAGLISKIEELGNDPQLRARNALVSVTHSKLGNIQVVAALPKLSATPASVRRAAPVLGEHTDQVLVELGYSKKQIVSMRSKGVI
jgi:CoA:oxalate CoA-transferase